MIVCRHRQVVLPPRAIHLPQPRSLRPASNQTLSHQMLLAVAGMVGVGKSTLTRALAARFGLQLALESVDDDNPWLERYYSNGEESRRAWGLQLQLHFLATRFAAMRQMRAQGGSWILD